MHTTVHVAQQLHTLDMCLPTPTYHALLSRDVLSSVGLRTMGEYKLGWLKGVAHPANQQASTMVHSTAGQPVCFLSCHCCDQGQWTTSFRHSYAATA